MINEVNQPLELPLLNLHLSAGHSNNPKRDRGAVGNGQIEGVLSARLRDKIILHLNKSGYRVYADGDDTILSDSLKYFKGKTDSKSIVIDIHFNSATPTATGVETIIPSKYTSKELELAYGASNIIGNIMGIPLRGATGGKKGVKTELETHHGKLGWMTIVGHTILLEICFISNPKEIKTYLDNEDKIAIELANYFLNEVCKVVNDVVVEYYTIKSGDSLSKIAKDNNTTVAKLQELNNIKDPSKISIGQRIKLK